jgi:biopolymer transport protein TolQ
VLENSFFKTGVFDLILNAGPVAKFVLVLLAIFSVFCWAIIFEKLLYFWRIKRVSIRFLKGLNSENSFIKAYREAVKSRDNPLSQLYIAAYKEISSDLLTVQSPEGPMVVNIKQVEIVNRAMRRISSSEISRMERYLPFLATTASAAPFIGLFGTVWGVMESFRGIGSQGSASLAVVAPGISEALIATAAGLGVAIPAVMAYNFFVNKVKDWARKLDRQTLEITNQFSRLEK